MRANANQVLWLEDRLLKSVLDWWPYDGVIVLQYVGLVNLN